MRNIFMPAAGAAVLVLASSARATPFDMFALGAGVGSNGVGGTVTTDLVPERLNLNIGAAGFTYGTHFNADEARFKAQATLGGEAVTLSLFPVAGSGFNLTGGLVLNQNAVTATAVPQAASYVFDGTTYTAAQVGSVSGRTHFTGVAPYIGLGWGDPVGPGSAWSVVVNAGAIYEGEAGVHLTATGEAANPALAADIAATQRSVNHDLNMLSWYPVVSIGVTYRF